MGAANSNVNIGNADSPENSALRTKAIGAFQRVAFCQIVVGGALLGCGITAIIHDDGSAFGPPYYVGAMVAGPLLLLASLCTIQIIRYTPNFSNSMEAKNTVTCAFQGDQIMSILTFMGLFMGFAMLGISGMLSKGCDWPNDCDDPETRETNRKIAIAICVLLAVTILLLVFVIYTICSSSAAYGVILNQRRHRMVILTQQSNQQAALQMQMMSNASNQNAAQMAALQQQNMLLQQQLALQQQQLQMQQQQQQQPTAYGGFAPPPPSYESVANPYPPMPSAPSDFGKM